MCVCVHSICMMSVHLFCIHKLLVVVVVVVLVVVVRRTEKLFSLPLTGPPNSQQWPQTRQLMNGADCGARSVQSSTQSVLHKSRQTQIDA